MNLCSVYILFEASNEQSIHPTPASVLQELRVVQIQSYKCELYANCGLEAGADSDFINLYQALLTNISFVNQYKLC